MEFGLCFLRFGVPSIVSTPSLNQGLARRCLHEIFAEFTGFYRPPATIFRGLPAIQPSEFGIRLRSMGLLELLLVQILSYKSPFIEWVTTDSGFNMPQRAYIKTAQWPLES